MVRTRKIQAAPETAEDGIKEIMATSVEKTLEEAAIYVNVSVFKLQEMFCDRLESGEPSGWDTVPCEHELLLDEFKRQMEAAATVKPHELPPALPVQEQEIPLIEEEAKPAGKLDKSKAPSTALTDKRKEALDKTHKGGRKGRKQVEDAVLLTKAQKGRKKGAKQAAVEIVAAEEAYHETMTQAALQQLADEITDTEDEANFNPYDYVRAAGSKDVDTVLTDALSKINPVLNVLGKSAQEIIDNSYSNGSTLDLSQLLNLMQSVD